MHKVYVDTYILKSIQNTFKCCTKITVVVQTVQVLALRAMLAVPYFEKALYELPEDQVTAENILALATKIEIEIQGGQQARPLLTVPHLLSDEASCYYHGMFTPPMLPLLLPLLLSLSPTHV